MSQRLPSDSPTKPTVYRTSSASSSSMSYSKQQQQLPSADAAAAATSLVYYVEVSDCEIEVRVPSDTTVEAFTQQVRQIAESIIGYELSQHIVCLETVDENEVIDYFLTQSDQRIAHIMQNTVLRLTYSEISRNSSASAASLTVLDFHFIKCLGKGGTSDVFLVRHKVTGKLFALKMIPKTHLSEYKRLEQLLRERKILMDAANAPFIASLHACFESEFHLNFLLEFYCGGELFFHLQTKKLTDAEAKFYFVEILIAFQYLHSNKILYRDLKPENIVLDMEGHVRLTDFGLSKIGMTREEMTDSFCGSPEYMAPEVLSRQGYNYSVDFYTLGAFLYELVTGLPPFYSNDTDMILQNIQNNELEVPEHLDNDLQDLLYSLLDKQPTNRIKTFEEIKSSPWFDDVNWRDILELKVQPPIRIDINQSYIHSEFREVPVPEFASQKSSQESLFTFFYYVNPFSAKQLNLPETLSEKSIQKSTCDRPRPSSSTKRMHNSLQGPISQLNINTAATAISRSGQNSFNFQELNSSHSENNNNNNIPKSFVKSSASTNNPGLLRTSTTTTALSSNGTAYYFTNPPPFNQQLVQQQPVLPQVPSDNLSSGAEGTDECPTSFRNNGSLSSGTQNGLFKRTNTENSANRHPQATASTTKNQQKPKKLSEQSNNPSNIPRNPSSKSSSSAMKQTHHSTNSTSTSAMASVLGNSPASSFMNPTSQGNRFLDLDCFKTSAIAVNSSLKDKQQQSSTESTTHIKNFLKNHLNLSTKNLKSPPIHHPNHHQAPTIATTGTLSQSQEKKKRFLSPCYSPKNQNLEMHKQRPSTASKKKQNSLLLLPDNDFMHSQDIKYSNNTSSSSNINNNNNNNSINGFKKVNSTNSLLSKQQQKPSQKSIQSNSHSNYHLNNNTNSSNNNNHYHSASLVNKENTYQLSNINVNINAADKKKFSTISTPSYQQPPQFEYSAGSVYSSIDPAHYNTTASLHQSNNSKKKLKKGGSFQVQSAVSIASPASINFEKYLSHEPNNFDFLKVNHINNVNTNSPSKSSSQQTSQYLTKQHNSMRSLINQQIAAQTSTTTPTSQLSQQLRNAAKSTATKPDSLSKQKPNHNSRKSLEPKSMPLAKNSFIKYFDGITMQEKKAINSNNSQPLQPMNPLKYSLKDIPSAMGKPLDSAPNSTTNANKRLTLNANI